MDSVLDSATFTVTRSGREFVLKRRSALLMLEARGFSKAMGILASGTSEGHKITLEDQIEMSKAVLRVAMVDPFLAVDEPPDPPRSYSYEQIAHVALQLWSDVINSGLPLDPTQPSCEDKAAE